MASKVKAFDYGDNSAPNFPNDYEIVDKIMLQCTDIKNNNNKFYAMELHKSNNQYRIFTEYGRTGVTGKKECRFYNSEKSSRDDYNTILRDKNKKGYAQVEVAQSAKGSDKGKLVSKIEINSSPTIITNSKLSLDVQSFVKQIYEESGSKLSYMLNTSAIGATDKSPLGTLSVDQIQKGFNKLSEIRKQITGKPNDAVTDLTSDYFKTIPKKLPAKLSVYDTIFTIDKADQEEELLNLLRDSLQVQKGFGSGIDTQYDQIGADIELLDNTSKEWKRISDKIAHTHDSGHNHSLQINRIFKIKTHTDLKFRSDLNNIQELYHGSRSANIVGILKNSLRIRPSGVVTAGTMFGPAIYLADQVTKSTNYSLGSWAGSGNKYPNAFVFLVDGALGSMKEVTSSHYFTEPPRGYNSVKGCKGYSLRNNEYMVYDPNQAELRYIVDFTPKYHNKSW